VSGALGVDLHDCLRPVPVDPALLLHPLLQVFLRPLPEDLNPVCAVDPEAPLLLGSRLLLLELRLPTLPEHELLQEGLEVALLRLLLLLPPLAHDQEPLAHLAGAQGRALVQTLPLRVGQFGAEGQGVCLHGGLVQAVQQGARVLAQQGGQVSFCEVAGVEQGEGGGTGRVAEQTFQ